MEVAPTPTHLPPIAIHSLSSRKAATSGAGLVSASPQPPAHAPRSPPSREMGSPTTMSSPKSAFTTPPRVPSSSTSKTIQPPGISPSPEGQSPKQRPRQYKRPPSLRVSPKDNLEDIPVTAPFSPPRQHSARPTVTPRSVSHQGKSARSFMFGRPRRASSLDGIRPTYQHTSPVLPEVTFEAFDQTLPPDFLLPSLHLNTPGNVVRGVSTSRGTLSGTNTTDATKRASDLCARRWHVLMELLTTEIGYVHDLRVLVDIYLEQLAGITTIPADARTSISRNAKDLYHFHEAFSAEIDAAIVGEDIKGLKPRAASAAEVTRIEQAVQKVCDCFVAQASQFHLYQSFCSGHPEALDTIRRMQLRPEWDMYEKRCAVLAAGGRSDLPNAHGRRHSTDVIDTQSAAQGNTKTSKLTLRDFLIKPVQRICRYPMLLGQLLEDSGQDAELDGVSGALKTMKDVAALVDEARRQTEVATKTRLIIERTDASEGVTSEYLTSLGNCVLAGSLDVLYHHEIIAPLSTPVKVKYMGVFLYFGWILIVKVLKSKTYEPRHWFPLASMDMVDIDEEQALCPSSFRLSSGSHHFELAAACQREKMLWMTAIAEARPRITNPDLELLSNLTSSAHAFSSTSGINTPDYRSRSSLSRQTSFEQRNATLPELSSIVSAAVARRSASSDRTNDSSAVSVPSLSRIDPLASLHRPPTRRNSATLRSLFNNNDPSSILIRRASTTYRILVDRALGDVFSDVCLAVRLQAQVKEPLFQPPKLTNHASKALIAKNKITRRESVLIRRQRSLVDMGTENGSTSTFSARPSPSSKFSLSRNKSVFSSGSLKESARRSITVVSLSFFTSKELPKASEAEAGVSEDGVRAGSMSPSSAASSSTSPHFRQSPLIETMLDGPTNSHQKVRRSMTQAADTTSSLLSPQKTRLSATDPSISTTRDPPRLVNVERPLPPIPAEESTTRNPPPQLRSRLSMKRASKFFTGNIPLSLPPKFLKVESDGESRSPGSAAGGESPYSAGPLPTATPSSTDPESGPLHTPSVSDSTGSSVASTFFRKFVTPKRPKTAPSHQSLFSKSHTGLWKDQSGTVNRAGSNAPAISGEDDFQFSESALGWELVDGEQSPITPSMVHVEMPHSEDSHGRVTPSPSPSEPPARLATIKKKRGSRFLQHLNPLTPIARDV